MSDMMPHHNRPDAPAVTNPFDALRQVRPDGSEFWSARALMHVMGYSRWEHFQRPLDRAMSTARNTGLAIEEVFRGYRKNPEAGGRPSEDVELSRHAAYLVAMNGDPNKVQVAAAQAYFAVRTRQAEVVEETAPPPAAPASALPTTYVEALEVLLHTARARQEAEERVAELAPAARSWELIAAEDRRGDFSVREAAQQLCRAGVQTGQNRLFADMRRWEWLMGNGLPYQRYVDRGWLVLRPLSYDHPHTGEPRLTSQVRVTAAGVDAAHDLYVRERQVPLPRFPGRGGARPLAGNPG